MVRALEKMEVSVRKLLLLVLGMYGFVASHAIAEPNWTRYSDCAGGQVISKGCQSQYSAAFPSEPKCLSGIICYPGKAF